MGRFLPGPSNSDEGISSFLRIRGLGRIYPRSHHPSDKDLSLGPRSESTPGAPSSEARFGYSGSHADRPPSAPAHLQKISILWRRIEKYMPGVGRTREFRRFTPRGCDSP